jgi:two-component system sensor histidine kinase FlrB
MLPSSHNVLTNASATGIPVAEESRSGHAESNHEPAIVAKDSDLLSPRTEAFVLADAFSDFISTSSRLEASYRELHEEVNALRLELEVRNAALATSRADNDRMRCALQQIVDSMPCGVLVVEKEGMISIINPECAKVLCLDSTMRMNGVPPSLREISLESGINLELLCEHRSNSEAAHELCVRRDSGNRWLEVRNRRIYERLGGEGRPDQTILILRDITAQKRAEEERENGRRAMALAEITTMLAHEIRNPLASLELFAEMIDKDPSRTREWVSSLKAGIRSLSGTVNNVLSFHGAGSLTLIPIYLSNVVNGAIQFAQPLADQVDVSLQWNGAGDSHSVMGNASALQQVILNLITNALRYTPAKGSVEIALGANDSAIGDRDPMTQTKTYTVDVSDSGCGIREDAADQIFKAGFSGNNDRTGLGLAVCDRIMKQHGGHISVSNNPQSGARFILEFPTFPLEGA